MELALLFLEMIFMLTQLIYIPCSVIAVLLKSRNELNKNVFFISTIGVVAIELSCRKYLCLAQPSTEIDYSTTSPPDFYKDEEITFRCEASGYTDLKVLQLRYEADGDSEPYRSGCIPSSENDTVWEGSSTPDIFDFPGIEGPEVSNEYCISVGKPEGFNLTVQLTITDSTPKGKFYCRGFEGGGVGEVLSSEVLMKVKGEYF